MECRERELLGSSVRHLGGDDSTMMAEVASDG